MAKANKDPGSRAKLRQFFLDNLNQVLDSKALIEMVLPVKCAVRRQGSHILMMPGEKLGYTLGI